MVGDHRDLDLDDLNDDLKFGAVIRTMGGEQFMTVETFEEIVAKMEDADGMGFIEITTNREDEGLARVKLRAPAIISIHEVTDKMYMGWKEHRDAQRKREDDGTDGVTLREILKLEG